MFWVAVLKTQTNFDFFMVDNYFFGTCFLGGRWGVKNYKNSFQPTFSPFQAILNNLDFLHCWQKNGGGGTQNYLFKIFHLVRHNWIYIQNFRPLWPFLVVFLWWEKQKTKNKKLTSFNSYLSFSSKLSWVKVDQYV